MSEEGSECLAHYKERPRDHTLISISLRLWNFQIRGLTNSVVVLKHCFALFEC